ncbi:EAL domain-containing protein [Porphyrobacter sp. AAP60]|uniref:EAL domain-containing protein n=1 Tax=Porphyrobacter sp. AAP60 TaxID=1523423 RepID=UPI0006B9CF1F|nr:EAL domain-containing protein [Porphyrobacter sp. AAP60]
MRRGFGPAGDAAAGIPQLLARNPGGVGSLLRRKRAKVAALAVLFGLVSAAIELPLPAEDFYRAVRAEIRSRPAPQDIAMIAIDDKTLNAFNRDKPSRVHDSQLIDRLFASGVERIAFDRAHADPENPKADALFARTLERHKGKVWLGFSPKHEVGFQIVDEIVPLKEFRENANLAAMNAIGSPFRLSLTLFTKVGLAGVSHPSLSAALAGYDGPERKYRPDYAFDPRTIPTFSYIDVLNGGVPATVLAGKAVVVGSSYYESSDYHLMPLRDGRVAGAYFHIMGAHTLKRGVPADFMWYPAMLVAGIAIFALMLGRTKSTRSLLGVGVGLLFIPLLFDEFGINVDIMPAVLALLWAGIGFKRLAHKYYSSEVDAMTTSAISSDKANSESDVYALKIASLSEISDDWSARELGEFVNTLIAYVKGPGDTGDVAFERDILVWLAPRMIVDDLERHADGLALMLKTAISHDWRSASTGPALGIDTNHALPLSQRIRKAMQAAEEAGSRGARFIINDAAHLEARNQRMELLRVLEKGLRERSITVAYQPKVDLRSGRIVGAETLIRWQPDGGDYVNPQELVLAAEAGDRINELTLVVMEAALADGKQAIALDPAFKLAVNMSAKSLSDTHLLFDIMTMLGRHAFPPQNLTLELTETAKLEDERIAPQIKALKQRGICLSIDDFGTGQSNLEYIEKLPSSELKIDKKFVQHMATSDESLAVVRATIEIAHSLGKIVVAEGVEQQSVAATLLAMGCDHAQGYLFSPAIAMPDLLAMMCGGRSVVNA